MIDNLKDNIQENVNETKYEYILEMNHISKEFPGVKALDDVTIKVKKGRVLSLMGENGAGKSTLMKCLFGVYHLDQGEIILAGKHINFHNPKQALAGGVSMVQQELNQITTRSVMENMFLGRFPKKWKFIVDHNKMKKDANKIFDDLKIEGINPLQILSRLSVCDREMVEIAKAVSIDSKVVVFDEPTSSLADREIEKLFEIINHLKEKGFGIIYISHKMDEIFKISDDIAILRDGKLVVQDEVSKFDMNKIIKLMVGRSLENRFPEKINNVGKTLFECESISSKYDDDIKDIKFDLKEGEILGIAGLVGSGRTEVLELIFGLRTSTKDTSLKIDGVSISNTNPKNAMKNGFALVTEERRATGIFKVLSVYDNTVMANLGNYSKYGFLKTKNSLNESLSIISSLRVKTPSYKTRISSLSGGNQQKVIIGRWLLTNPKVLLLDEPTRGIDVLAKYEIYQFMIEIAKENKGVIMVSSEMPELLGITDRILVMSNKRVAGILETKNTNQEEIMHLAEKYM